MRYLRGAEDDRYRDTEVQRLTGREVQRCRGAVQGNRDRNWRLDGTNRPSTGSTGPIDLVQAVQGQ